MITTLRIPKLFIPQGTWTSLYEWIYDNHDLYGYMPYNEELDALVIPPFAIHRFLGDETIPEYEEARQELSDILTEELYPYAKERGLAGDRYPILVTTED